MRAGSRGRAPGYITAWRPVSREPPRTAGKARRRGRPPLRRWCAGRPATWRPPRPRHKAARPLASASRASVMAVSCGVLFVVQVVGLGRGEQDAFDPRAPSRPASQPVWPTRKAPAHRPWRGAGPRPLGAPDGWRLEHVDQHDLAVDAGEVVAEEGCHDAVLVGVEAPLHLAPEAAAGGGGGARQRRKGQDRAAGQIAGQEEAARRAGRKPRRACGRADRR
jgi:hypothetical protein